MKPPPNQDNYLDRNPESIVPNPHTKPTEFLLNFSYTGPHFSSSDYLDVNARQKKFTFEDFTNSRGNRFRIRWDGWYLSAHIIHNNDVYDLHDQDLFHNGIFFVNPLYLPSRHLILGNENATLNHIYLVYHSFSVDRHGLQPTGRRHKA